MESRLSEFRGHVEIDRFMAQFERESLSNLFRFKCLLFRGDSESGKSKRKQPFRYRVHIDGGRPGHGTRPAEYPSIRQTAPFGHSVGRNRTVSGVAEQDGVPVWLGTSRSATERVQWLRLHEVALPSTDVVVQQQV